MATPGYVDVESTIENKQGDGRISVEAPPLTAGTPDTYVFKRYPVAVVKPIYIPNTLDSTSCIGEGINKRLIEWISATAVQVKTRQPYDVWTASVVRHNVDGETYSSLLAFASFENITYADLVDMAAVFKRYEPKNLILDDGRYPALDAFIPNKSFMTEHFGYATKVRAAVTQTPDLKEWVADDSAPRQARHAAPDNEQPATTGAAQETSTGDIEAWFS